MPALARVISAPPRPDRALPARLVAAGRFLCRCPVPAPSPAEWGACGTCLFPIPTREESSDA